MRLFLILCLSVAMSSDAALTSTMNKVSSYNVAVETNVPGLSTNLQTTLQSIQTNVSRIPAIELALTNAILETTTLSNWVVYTVGVGAANLAIATNYVIGYSDATYRLLTNADGVINGNLASVSNSFVELQGVVNTNARLSATNALIANWNQGTLDRQVSNMAYNIYRAFTNIPGFSPTTNNIFGWNYPWQAEDSSFANSTSVISLATVDFASALTSWVAVVSAADQAYAQGLYALNSNGLATLNRNFGAISNDFVSISNTLFNTTDGVVPLVVTNQSITAGNFGLVNSNYVSFSNAIYSVASNIFHSINPGGSYSRTNVSIPYVLMNTNYVTNYPTSMNITFPSLTSTVAGVALGVVQQQIPAIQSGVVTQLVIGGEASGYAGVITWTVSTNEDISPVAGSALGGPVSGALGGTNVWYVNSQTVSGGGGYYNFNCWFASGTNTSGGDGVQQPIKFVDSDNALLSYNIHPTSVNDAGDFSFSAIVPSNGVIKLAVRFVNNDAINGSYIQVTAMYNKIILTE